MGDWQLLALVSAITYGVAMGQIPIVFAIAIGILLAPVNAMAQRADKTTPRTGKSGTKSSRSSHTPSTSHSASPKNSTRTSKSTSPAVSTSAASPDGSDAVLQAMEVDRVTSLEQERLQADIKKDGRWFADCLGDDLTSVTSDGRLENKAQVIARSLDPGNVVESEKYDELSVRAYGDVIVATGKLLQTAKGNNTQKRFTDVWVNRGGMWQQVASHVSPIEAGGLASQSAAPAASPSPAAIQPSQSIAKPSASVSPEP